MRASWNQVKGFGAVPTKKRRVDKEGPIHTAVYNWLATNLIGVVYHCPNGLHGGGEVVFIKGKPVRRAAIAWGKLKQKGARSGVLDLTLHWRDPFDGTPKTGYVEIKSEEGSLEKEQKEFIDALNSVGIPHALARSVEDIRQISAEWRLPLRFKGL